MTANDRDASRRTTVGVLASGRGSNLLALLRAQDGGSLEAAIRVVISDVASAKALEHARRHGVEALHLPPGPFKTRLGEAKEQDYVRALRDRDVDLVVLAGFMRVVHAPFFEAFRGRIVNIHPSLLPSFPGLKAQRQALEHGVKVTGCTVHFVEEQVDAGPIIAQAPVPVLDDDTEETLSARILEEEHRLIVEAVNRVAAGRVSVRAPLHQQRPIEGRVVMPDVDKDMLEAPAGFRSKEAGLFSVQMDDLHRRLARDTRGLTPEELEWQPKPGTNTIGMLLSHIALVEVAWVQVGPLGLDRHDIENVLGIGSDDDGMPLAQGGRPAATLQGKDLAFYDDLIAKGRAYVRRALEALTDSDLERVITRRRSDRVREFNVRWVLYHIVEHTAGHYGQVNLLRHLHRLSALKEST